MLDTARFTNNVAEELGVPVGSVQTLTLGSHGDTMVPVPSRCTVDGKPLSDVMAAGPDRRPRRPAPATAAPRSWRCSRPGRRTTRRPRPPPAWPRRSIEDSGAVMPVCAWVDGEYGINGVYLGVEAEIGREGVRKVVETRPHRERAGRRCSEAAEAVRAKQADVADL